MSDDAPAIKQRLVEYLKFKKLKMAQLEKKAGLANAYLRNSNGAIGAPKLRDILHACPDLDANWLLTGMGEMLKSVGGDVQNISGSNAKGVLKGNMTINETDEMLALTNITIDNIDNIDLTQVPQCLTQFLSDVRQLKREHDALITDFEEAKNKSIRLEEKCDELTKELLEVYRSKAQN